MKQYGVYIIAVVVLLIGLTVWLLQSGSEGNGVVLVNGTDMFPEEIEFPEEFITSPTTTPPPAELTSGTWVWERTVMNDDTIIEPAQPEAFTLTFTQDGMLYGSTDCNGFSGSYELDGTELTSGPFAMTMMFCEGSQETEFINMVDTAQFIFFTEEGNLVLLLPYDSGSVIFSQEL